MSSPNPHPRLVRTAAAGLTILTAGRTALFALGGPARPPTGVAEQQRLALEDYTFAHDDILGTSLDMIVGAARPGDAVRCQEAVLAEIERLRAILSTYDPASEISRVSLGLQPVAAPELRQLLAAYDDWSARTGGLVDARLNQVVRDSGGRPRGPARYRPRRNSARRSRPPAPSTWTPWARLTS
jgi:thiamine biosynthesis lipoprotein ApbE